MKTYILILLTILALGVSGCEGFLDRAPLGEASEDTFWKTAQDAEKGVNALYRMMPGQRDFWRDGESDNSLMTNAWGEGGLGYISQGIHNASTWYLNEEWVYGDIRQILYYIDRVTNMEFDATLKNRYLGEARYLLALKYFRMTRHFGDLPLIKEKPISLEEAALPRSPKQEVLDYVIENVNFAIANLPIKHSDANIGRITKGAALMLKAEIYMDMASISKFHKGSDQPKLWKEAASCAQQVIDLGIYELEDDFAFIFTAAANNNNKEAIIADQFLENERTHMLPVLASAAGTGISGDGWAGFCPTRDLVDSYLMIDGKSIYESSLYDMNNPWENRDTRLKKSFMLPGVPVLRPNSKYEPYMPHPDYNKPERMNNEGGGITGFLYLKYNDHNLIKPYVSWINYTIYRYAETLLFLAEALNECEPGNPQIKWAIDKIRTRAKVAIVTNEEAASQDIMRTIIRNERRYEFPAEHKRYFDILRWKIAEVVLSKDGYGINKDKNVPIGDYNAECFLGQKRNFDPSKNYLWPIPQDVIDKNPNIKQNPGW